MTSSSKLPTPGDSLDPAQFRESGQRVVTLLADYLEAALARELPVLPVAEPRALLQEWADSFSSDVAGDLEAELIRLLEEVLSHSTHLHHPGYIGHQVAVPLPLAALVELTNALLNNGMAVYEMGQLQTVMELEVVSYLCELLGLGASSGGLLTHGGSLGNLTALLAMRQARAGQDVWDAGNGSQMSVLVADSAHYSISRAVQIMGWGSAGAWKVRSTDRGEIDVDDLAPALEQAVAAGRHVIGVVANSCTTATGRFDPIDELADFCARHELWLHVDGAHGASLAFSRKHRHLLAGIERADSVVWDLHKMLGLPALNTAVLFREQEDSAAAFTEQAAYLFEEGEDFDLGHRSVECTKRGMGMTAYVMLQLLGTEWFADHVDTLVDKAQSFATLIEEQADFALACPPQANIVCFRYVGRGELPSQELDDLQRRIRSRVIATGRYYIVETKLSGSQWLRVTLMNPRTAPSDLEGLLETIREVAVE